MVYWIRFLCHFVAPENLQHLSNQLEMSFAKQSSFNEFCHIFAHELVVIQDILS